MSRRPVAPVQPRPDGAVGFGGVSLTDKEAECMAHSANLLDAKETAAAMGISITTVRGHLESCRRKFDVSTSRQAVRRYVALGGIPSEVEGDQQLRVSDQTYIAPIPQSVESGEPGKLRDSAFDREVNASSTRVSIGRVLDEVLSGSRSGGLSLIQQGLLVVVSVMVVGFVYFGLSAITAVGLATARLVRAATH